MKVKVRAEFNLWLDEERNNPPITDMAEFVSRIINNASNCGAVCDISKIDIEVLRD